MNETENNWEAECKRVCALYEEAKDTIRIISEREHKLESVLEEERQKLSGHEKKILFLEGQLEAFRYCIAKGGKGCG